MEKAFHYFINLLFTSLLFCIGILPRKMLVLLSNSLAFIIIHFIGYRYKVVMDNLRLAFPHKTDKELHKIARGSYRAFIDTMLNIFRIRFASQKRVLRTVKFLNVDLMQRLYEQQKNGIILAGHYSCWEYIGTAQKDIKHQTVAAYQPLSFRALEKVITDGRSRFGAKMAALRDVFRVLMEHNNANKKTMTLMVADQSPSRGECKQWLTFLGQPTPFFINPERIAQKINATVMYLRIIEKKRFSYEYELVVLADNAAQEMPSSVTHKFYTELEKDILHSPQLWMWTHKRWKHKDLYQQITE
ncbi:MAG: lysophospholipid acyltransferase family protein [Bacteroidales bacterium]